MLVWGCFSYNGTGKLEVIQGKLKSGDYVNVLEKSLLDSMAKLGLPNDFIFQQDNDPKHTSKLSKDFFVKNKVNVLSWPRQSSDLNPI